MKIVREFAPLARQTRTKRSAHRLAGAGRARPTTKTETHIQERRVAALRREALAANPMAKEKQILEIPDFVTVRDLADLMDASPIEVMKELISNGIMATINQQIDYDTAAIVADGMGYEP